MADKHIHIVSFDVPYPPNYGGVIDVYYKIKALHKLGIQVHLHCYEYGRGKAKELEQICKKVYYYKRNMQKKQLLSTIPFIVISRSSEELMRNLLLNDYPILFEGLHTCYHLNDERISNRIKIVRMHNIEHHYYKGLERAEKSSLKIFYFGEEADKLKQFEKVLHQGSHIVAISKTDANELASRYYHVNFIGAFHAANEVSILPGKGDYCLYHGNLSVGDNNEAALFLVEHVFSKIKTPLIIAGQKPTKELLRAAAAHSHIQVKENVDNETMLQLVQNAQINLLPTFQGAGIKLKLLAALFSGRHCIVNDVMVNNTGLEELCSIKNTAEDIASEIKRLFETPIAKGEKEKREQVLFKDFSNEKNAKKIMELI